MRVSRAEAEILSIAMEPDGFGQAYCGTHQDGDSAREFGSAKGNLRLGRRE